LPNVWAHAGKQDPVVGEPEARLAIHIAAGFIGYLAARVSPREA
jgi:hypothetical protein